MKLLHRLASVVSWVFRRDKAERHLDDELQAFIELSVADKVRSGVPRTEALRQAKLELGGIEQAKERVRTYRHGGGLDEVGRDVRYAFRTFIRTPGFTVVVVLTLALGIGANTAIFSLIDALMLRSLPVPNPQELVMVEFQPAKPTDPPGSTFSYAIAKVFDEQRDIFETAGGFSGFSYDVGAPGSIVRVQGAIVTGGYYETLGLNPALGRLLTRQDDEAGAPLVAVLSHGYWERQHALRPDVIGQTMLIAGLPVTIVGVSPAGFVGANVGEVADITMAAAMLPQVKPSAAPLLGKGNFWMRVLARPRAGMPAEQAAARLNAVWPQASAPAIPSHWPVSRREALAGAKFQLSAGATGWTFLRQMYVKPLMVLMAVVGLVLLIACANVASLLLARASARQREIAVRMAIGAGRGRIARQLLIESTLLSLISAAFGVVLAWASGRFLVTLISRGPFQVTFDLAPNWRVLAFTSAVAIATGLLFGIAPALQTPAEGPSPVLKTARTSNSLSRLLPWLVSGQVALSLVLLAGAGLFLRTLHNLQNIDPGFKSDGVLLVNLEEHRIAVPQALLDDVLRLPGVMSATLSTHTPMSGAVWSEPAVPAGQTVPERDNAFFIGAGPGFFATMQIPILSGREFSSRDSAGAPGVAIVNEAYAQRHFPNQNPVGQHLAASVRGQRRDLEIVGLSRNTSAAGLRNDPPATVYVAYSQLTGDLPTNVTVRATGALGQVSSVIQQTLQTRLGGPVEVRALSAQVQATLVQEQMMATLGSAFGLLALILACVGLYGLLAYGVAQRTKEIGIRMALGAQRARVVALVLQRGTRLVLFGIAIGTPVAWMASRGVKSMLFGLTPADPVAILGAVVLLMAAAQLAGYIPARRAARVDPLVALRHE